MADQELTWWGWGTEAIRKSLRRHSFRHLLPHAGRALVFPTDRCETLGRWGWLKAMSTRYAAEVEFADYVRLIKEIVDLIVETLRTVPIGEWPHLGGWELLVFRKSPELDGVRRQLSLTLIEKHPSDGTRTRRRRAVCVLAPVPWLARASSRKGGSHRRAGSSLRRPHCPGRIIRCGGTLTM